MDSVFLTPALLRSLMLCDELARVIASTAPPNGRIVLFGHSLGSLLAYEVSCRLQARNIPVHALIVSARRPPHSPTPHPWIHTMPDSAVIDSLRRLGGMPEEIQTHSDFMTKKIAQGSYSDRTTPVGIFT
jgi:surfactin synthase thioesterase subunit